MYLEQVSSKWKKKTFRSHPLETKDCQIAITPSKKIVAVGIDEWGFRRTQERLDDITVTFLDKKGNIVGKDKWRALIKRGTKETLDEQSKGLSLFLAEWYCWEIKIDLSKSIPFCKKEGEL